MFSRRTTHSLIAAAVAGLSYAAAAELGSRKPVRVGGLLMLSTLGMAKLLSPHASVKATTLEARLNQHISDAAPAINLVANGGTIGGALVAPSLSLSGNLNMNGHNVNAIGSLGGNSANIGTFNGFTMGGNIDLNGNGLNGILQFTSNSGNIPVNGGGFNMNGNIDMQGHNVNDIGTLGGNSANIATSNGFTMGGNINMNGHNCNNGTSYT